MNLGSIGPQRRLRVKRVSVDLIGPNKPASDKENRYDLGLVNYATSYPEAVSLESIDIETVAEEL